MPVRLLRLVVLGFLLTVLVACRRATGPTSPSLVTRPPATLTPTAAHAAGLTPTLTPPAPPTATSEPTPIVRPSAAVYGCGQSAGAPSTAAALPSQPTDVLLQLEWGAGARWPVDYDQPAWPYGSEPFGRVPELTLLPDGSLLYLDGDIQVVHLTQAEQRELIQSVVDLGIERLESYIDPCRRLADGACQCVADASSSTLRLREAGGQLREISNYADYANYPHTLEAIRELLEAYRNPNAQRFVPEWATLFIKPVAASSDVGAGVWPLDPAWLPAPDAGDGPCTQVVSGSDLTALLDVTYKDVGLFYFAQGAQAYEVFMVPWLPNADYRALVRASSRPCSPTAAGEGPMSTATPSAIPPAQPAGQPGAATPSAGSHLVLLSKPAPTVRPGWTTYPARHYATNLALDRAGHVWAATLGGVLEVDPAQGTFTRYTEDEGLLSHELYSVLAAPDGSLWFGTGRGITHRVGATWTSYAVTIGDRQVSICSLRAAPDERLWAEACRWYASKESGGGEVALFDGQAWRPAQAEDGPPPDFRNTITQGPGGSVWAARDRGVARLDGKSWTEFANPDWPTQVFGQSLAVAPDGSVWVGTQSGGVAHFDGQNWTTYTTDQGLPSDWVGSVALAPDGSVWVGTLDGLARFDGVAWTSFGTGGGLVGDLVDSIALGPDGARWFVTHDGISRLADGAWTSYLWAPGGVYGQPLGIAPDGSAWMLPGSDLRRVDGASWPASYPSPGKVQRIVPSADGSLWVAGPGRLVHFVASQPTGAGLTSMPVGFVATSYESGCLSGLEATALSPAPDGTLWIGTASNGVVQFDPRAAARGEMACTFHTSLGGEADDWVGSVAAIAVAAHAAAGTGYTVWVGTVSGLSRYDGKAWTLKTDVGGCLYTHEVHALAASPEGDLWVGVPCGLVQFDGLAWSVYTVADGLAADWVESLAVAPDGSLWIGTPSGAQHFRPGESLPPVAAKRPNAPSQGPRLSKPRAE